MICIRLRCNAPPRSCCDPHHARGRRLRNLCASLNLRATTIKGAGQIRGSDRPTGSPCQRLPKIRAVPCVCLRVPTRPSWDHQFVLLVEELAAVFAARPLRQPSAIQAPFERCLTLFPCRSKPDEQCCPKGRFLRMPSQKCSAPRSGPGEVSIRKHFLPSL